MRQVLLLGALACICAAGISGNPYCESGWTFFSKTSKCYRRYFNASYDEAEAICQKSGAHLTSIHSDEENLFVLDMSKAGVELGLDPLKSIWIGLHKVEGKWTNKDGTAVDYYNWAPGQPDNGGGNQDCARMNTDLFSDPNNKEQEQYDDFTCASKLRGFVCKKEAQYYANDCQPNVPVTPITTGRPVTPTGSTNQPGVSTTIGSIISTTKTPDVSTTPRPTPSCTQTSCGTNAKCSINNRQLICTCPPGYSGDPTKECNIKTRTACANGDPHYLTFDGFFYDYQSTCPVVFSKPCKKLAGGYDNYEVTHKNELTKPGAFVSVVSEVDVVMFGQKIHFDRNKPAVYFNKKQITGFPYFWPNANNASITVDFKEGLFTAASVQHVTVTLQIISYYAKLCITVPDILEFQGNGTLCGLAGNIDNDWKNDIISSDGTVYKLPLDSTRPEYTPETAVSFNKAVDTWIVKDFFLTTGSLNCSTGETLTNLSNCSVTPAISAACKPILDAKNGVGALSMCSGMDKTLIQRYYDDCLFDVCQDNSFKCDILTTFVSDCQSHLPNTDVGEWRANVSCPKTCSANAKYSSCTSSCPATCSNSDPATCKKGCVEGCQCLPGYVVDTTQTKETTCIKIQECGSCIDSDGNHRASDTTWLEKDCTLSAECKNGKYSSKPIKCSLSGFCGADENGNMACQCLDGYNGDGYNCDFEIPGNPTGVSTTGKPVNPTGSTGIPVNPPGSTGSPVNPTGSTGIPVNPPGSTGSPVNPTGTTRLPVNPPGSTGIPVNPPGSTGSPVNPTGSTGIPVNPPGSTGSPVNPTGTTRLPVNPPGSTGIPVNPPGSTGSPVNPTGSTGIPVNPPGSTGSPVNPTGTTRLPVNPPGSTGIPVNPPGSTGSPVNPTGSTGIPVNPPGSTGSPVNPTGSTGIPVNPPGSTGSPVNPTGTTRLPVNPPGSTGIPVNPPGSTGSPVNPPGSTGIPVNPPGTTGLPVNPPGSTNQPMPSTTERPTPKCLPNSCGVNATCTVNNRQLVCTCPLGMSGDPMKECNVKIQVACAFGDPHYFTFDGFAYDYQSTCPVVFSKPCKKMTGGYDNYEVISKSELTHPGSQVSVTSEVDIVMFGQKIHLDRNKPAAYFNKRQITGFPYYWPNANNASITITFNEGQFTVASIQYVTVTFSMSTWLCIAVPDVIEFRGKETLCGLAGNIDSNKTNDIISSDGTVYKLPLDSTRPEYTPETAVSFNKAVDTWTVKDFFLTTGSLNCSTGEILTNSSNCSVAPAIDACKPILDAMNGVGIFAMCSKMDKTLIQNLYDNCVFDVCQDNSFKCDALTSFAATCQIKLPNTDVEEWRANVSCPKTCSANAKYSSCTSSCPATCSNSDPATCKKGCVEGCQCLPGYVVDTTQTKETTCIKIQECGSCIDSDGNHRASNSTWLEKDCTLSAECKNGKYSSKPIKCSLSGFCGADENGNMACQCLDGYNGDGYNCDFEIPGNPTGVSTTSKPKSTETPKVSEKPLTECQLRAKCDLDWKYFDKTNSCYKTFLNGSFDRAEEVCKIVGAHLVSIHSAEENSFVYSLAVTGKSGGYENNIWIGMTRINGTLVNVDGSKVDYENWSVGEPNNFGGYENCVQLYTDPVDGCVATAGCLETKWNDGNCDFIQRAFVCKKVAHDSQHEGASSTK